MNFALTGGNTKADEVYKDVMEENATRPLDSEIAEHGGGVASLTDPAEEETNKKFIQEYRKRLDELLKDGDDPMDALHKALDDTGASQIK